MELKPEIEKKAEAISGTIETKVFMRDKVREEDERRKNIKPDIEGISKKLADQIEKIEEKKKKETPNE
jgi:hypothetical protein